MTFLRSLAFAAALLLVLRDLCGRARPAVPPGATYVNEGSYGAQGARYLAPGGQE